ncbi:MAG: FHA domain-containing protein [Bacteriovoracaceae bacterium]|jgi:pSer/pThr/pTyr-binding forkhead associated (FHA) protein|nr:FHA domain-containing protein [Bacteriovoracaceae bacterium]
MELDVTRYGHSLFKVQVDDFNLLGGSKVFIGRSQNCHVVLDDHMLSRKHAAIYYENGSLYIESLSKFKKVKLNGVYVDKSPLSLQDQVAIEEYRLLVCDWSYQKNRRDSNEQDNDKTQVLENDEDKTQILNEEEQESNLDNFDDSVEKVEDIEEFAEEDKDASSLESESEFENEEFSNNDDSFSDDNFVQDDSNDYSDDGFSDSDFSNDGFDDGEDSSEKTRVFQSFAHYTLKISGDRAPFDRYTVEDNETFIGRDANKCQIHLDDNEVSSQHALIKKTLINLIIEDLNSSNGTVVNGERINRKELVEGDIVEIGSTTFTVDVHSELINNEQDILMPVEADQEIEVEEVVEEEVDFGEVSNADFSGEEVKEKSIIKRIWKDPKQRKKLIYGLVALMGLMLFMEEEKPSGINDSKTNKKSKIIKKKEEKKISLSKKHNPQTLERLEQNYALALAKYEAGEYYEAKEYSDIVYSIDSEYKDIKTLLALIKEGYEKLLKLKAKEEAEKERRQRQLKVEKLMIKVREAVKQRQVELAESLFSQVLEIDPENIDIPQLKLELEAYKKERERIESEKRRKEALRKSMLDALAPGKSFYLKQKWFKAINKLEEFNKKKHMDEDLIKEATDMLKESKRKLLALIEPLLGKAMSYKEGQDYKRAYETFGVVLKHDPANEVALNERDYILERLNNNSRRVYREALISESLSLFGEAKEKFEQVRQIAPINSEYYIKATDKLKEYMDE